jgi:hypothetical protein
MPKIKKFVAHLRFVQIAQKPRGVWGGARDTAPRKKARL